MLASGVMASANIHAGTYTAVLSGAIVDQQTSVMGVPGVSESYFSPLYQDPRLVPFGGPGWATELTISIDSNTGAVTDFKEMFTEGLEWGSGGPQAHQNTQGDHWETGVLFPDGCSITSANAGESGTIVFDCPNTTNVYGMATADMPGYRCLGVQPSTSNFSGTIACSNSWTGVNFPGGNPPLDPVFVAPGGYPGGSYIARPTNSNFGFVDEFNPPFFATRDRQYLYNGIDVNNTNNSRSGGTWTIQHSGAFSTGDFQVTSVDTVMYSNSNFPVGTLPPGEFISFTHGQYTVLENQHFQPSIDDLGKNVPAMGAFGLASLLTGLCIIGWRALKGTLS